MGSFFLWNLRRSYRGNTTICLVELSAWYLLLVLSPVNNTPLVAYDVAA